MIRQQPLSHDLIADGQVGKPAAIGAAVRRIARGTGGTLAAAQHVRGHDEPAFGVERPPGTDELIPPAASDVARAGRSADMAIRGQRMDHENGVIAGRRQFAPRLVGQARRPERASALQLQVAQIGELPAARVIPGPPSP